MRAVAFIAKRLSGGSGRVSRRAIIIATTAVAIGLMVMVLTLCVTHGFKTEIRSQIRSVCGDLRVVNALSLNDTEHALRMTIDDVEHIRACEGVASAERVVNNVGCLKTDSAFVGVQFVGVEYDTLTNTSVALADDEIIISESQASQLRLRVGDTVMAYFFDNTIRARRFVVVDTFVTNMSQFDDTQVFASYNTVHTLTGYDADECSYLRVYGHEVNCESEAEWWQTDLLTYVRSMHTNARDSQTTIVTVDQVYPQVFSWLGLLDMNVLIILALMLCVSGFTMASSLFIMILERVQMIGLMKAIGARFSLLRGVFLLIAAKILLRGMLIGNILAFLLVFIQQQWHVLHLNPADYYVDTVPFAVPWGEVLLMNLLTLLATIVILIVPTYLVNRIQPVRALKFD